MSLSKLALAAIMAGVLVSTSNGYNMKPVRSIQARVQGDMPSWDETNKVFVSQYGKTFDDRYRAVLDTVNTASVEGALMYVQAEGININQLQDCKRKNDMKYIVFYDFSIAQTNASLAQYQEQNNIYPEYCPFVAMDQGRCTPLNGNEVPQDCKLFNGDDGAPKIGACVGGEARETDPRAPYKDNIWFSFPNSCVRLPWANKTDECRTKNPGGLCKLGQQPDGISCTFSYKIMGYLKLDDLVGITKLANSKTKAPYTNYTEFCKDGGVEFKANLTETNLTVEKALPFWQDPTSVAANSARTQKMIEAYNEFVKSTVAEAKNMIPLPTSKELSDANPPCYQNAYRCANNENGCVRKLYAQVCMLCNSPDEECVKKPTNFSFPTLFKVKNSISSSGSKRSDSSRSDSKGNQSVAATQFVTVQLVATMTTMLAFAFLY